jgi:hypothetical protein
MAREQRGHYDLSELNEAFRRMIEDETHGKVILTPWAVARDQL